MGPGAESGPIPFEGMTASRIKNIRHHHKANIFVIRIRRSDNRHLERQVRIARVGWFCYIRRASGGSADASESGALELSGAGSPRKAPPLGSVLAAQGK